MKTLVVYFSRTGCTRKMAEEIACGAMGHRAECVMLNKGSHVVGAVRVLDDILRRMQAHQTQKRAMLRELRLARARPATP